VSQWSPADDALAMTDADRFEAFLREFQDMVFASAVRLLGNPVEAEDVAQTVFVKAFERFDSIGDSPAVAGWLKTVTTNLCLNHLARYRSRWRLFSELTRDDPSATPFEAHLVGDPGPAAGLEEADEHARLERALRQLPDHQRVPLVLFHFDEKSYQEIADLLGVSLGKIKTDIHRGREALRLELAPDHASR
jgi:RNA polymerase sigma-70 factor (ECF subfamily)